MAKKASADQAPESTPAKKTTTRKSSKPATKKTAEAKETAAKAAITSIAAATPTANAPKAEKKAPKSSKIKSPPVHAKPRQETGKQEQATPIAPVAPVASTAPSAAQEQKTPQPRQQPIIQVRRESFRPKQQENRHDDTSPNEGFSQPETVGGGESFSNNNNRNKRRNRNRNRRQNDERQDEQRPQDNMPGNGRKLDPDKLTKRAWKVFLAEVTEEGLALMDDNTARETAKRAFRVAEFFMQEESRRKHPNDQQRPPVRPNQPQATEPAPDKTNKEESADLPASEEN